MVSQRGSLHRDPRILLGQPRVLLDDPHLQLGDDLLLSRHERRQLLVGGSGHGPILHSSISIIRSRHASEDLNSHYIANRRHR